ncbi:SIMPL domain-containing protein [Devosia rhodophyticola]|uniref:SIMPL domain-containing protein n=1 Tax=Devosia rhodophyticola TaxID=3026423 RepID=A0ABY7YVP4_9HYPH|nr:SIMPL domain-containing protein [Devosia rhodophyticola]WDR05173.1 SIMPL domain-containing protein [Devosia rhodophyticola]
MRTFLALAPVALFAAMASPTLAGTIAINGHGEVSAAPDTAYVTSGVTTQGTTARDAFDQNTAAMAELIATLKDAGIQPRDIQTSGFSVNPNYVYSDQRTPSGYNQPPKISGYQVSNSVTVRVRALDTLGGVLDRAVTIGANTINGVTFAVADPSDLYKQARKQAFADALGNAELYATAANGTLGDIVTIEEVQNYAPPQPYMVKAMAEAAPRADVPVEAGELTFSADVSVKWDLSQSQ